MYSFVRLTLLSTAIGITACATGNGQGTCDDPECGLAELTDIRVQPGNAQLAVGDQLTFTAVGTYSDGSEDEISSSVTWRAANSSVVGMQGSTAYALQSGSTTVEASLAGITGTASVLVLASETTLESLSVTPLSPDLEVGESVQLTAFAHYSDNSSVNVSNTAAWGTSNSLVASVEDNGLVWAGSGGSAVITVAFSGKTAQAVVSVFEAPPELECSDGLDNDNDGDVDFPADPDCTSATDNSEAGNNGGPCDLVEQTGCAVGEKCTWVTVLEDPFLGMVDCVPSGAVGQDGACVVGPPGQTTGFDNCDEGLYCLGGSCQPICDDTDPNSCGAGASCGIYTDLFPEDSSVGLCQSTCDIFAQDCPAGDGCFLRPSDGDAVCSAELDSAPVHMQLCEANDAGNCFLNGCAMGHSPLLGMYHWDLDGDLDYETSEFDGLAGIPDFDRQFCANFCTPVDPDGNPAPNAWLTDCQYGAGKPIGAPSPQPSGWVYECRYYNTIYPEFLEGGVIFPQVGDEVGTCVPVPLGSRCINTSFTEPDADATAEEFLAAYVRDRGCLGLSTHAGDPRMWWVASAVKPGIQAKLRQYAKANPGAAADIADLLEP